MLYRCLDTPNLEILMAVIGAAEEAKNQLLSSTPSFMSARCPFISSAPSWCVWQRRPGFLSALCWTMATLDYVKSPGFRFSAVMYDGSSLAL